MAYVPKKDEPVKYHCEKCGDPVYEGDSCTGQSGSIMGEKNWCYSCAYWLRLLENPVKGRLIIEGGHYKGKPGIKRDRRDFLGMAGRTFTIRDLATGEVWKTNDLWFQGKINDAWREEFPDTHEFVKAKVHTGADGGLSWSAG